MSYDKEQFVLRLMQMVFGTKLFSLPVIYKLKNRVYSDLFRFGANAHLGSDIVIYRTHRCKGNIKIGDNVIIADHVSIDYSGKVRIGNNVTISEGTKIYSHAHDVKRLRMRENSVQPRCTSIGDGCWLGANSIILPGVSVGNDAVVGAGSVVTHNIPSGEVWAGNPAHKIRSSVIS